MARLELALRPVRVLLKPTCSSHRFTLRNCLTGAQYERVLKFMSGTRLRLRLFGDFGHLI